MHLTWRSFRPIVCAFTASVAAIALNAQSPSFAVGPGVSIPTGDYSRNDNTGWHALGAALVPSPVAHLLFRLDGMYSVATHQGSDLGHTKIAGGSASLQWQFRQEGQSLRPYLFMGIGFYGVMTTTVAPACYSAYCAGSNSRTDFAWSGGGGVEILRLGPAIGFLEARYIGLPTSVFPMTLGVVFGDR